MKILIEILVMWEMLTRKEPYSGLTSFNIPVAVGTQGKRPDVSLLPKGCPSGVKKLLKACWDPKYENFLKKFLGIF